MRIKRLSIYVPLIIAAALVTRQSHATVVINELLSNEPGSAVSLEWIELYNDSPTDANLAFYQLQIGATQFILSGTLPARGYLVICRKLISDATSPGFEGVWGNDSKVWGDTPQEQAFDVQMLPIILGNTSGFVQLILTSQVVSSLAWDSAGKDGYSWERVTPTGTTIKQSEDYTGSTPGFVNSVTPLPNDLAIDTASASTGGGQTNLIVYTRNAGLSVQSGRILSVYYYDPFNPSNPDSLIDQQTVPDISVGFTAAVTMTLTVPGIYRHLEVSLASDDRVRNNQFHLIVPGDLYPPIRLSEFLADPTGTIGTEWVELHNRSDSALPLSLWQLGDESTLSPIGGDNSPVTAGAYVILAEDSTAFRQSYPQYAGVLFEPSPWPSLNNSSDVLHLVDPFSIQADSFAYAKTYGGNFTWGRSEDSSALQWGRSSVAGGSPGQPNDILFEPQGGKTDIRIEPRAFAPGNGSANFATLYLTAPPADAYSLKIYDRVGRLVRTLVDDEPFIRDHYDWDGRDNGGEILPIGIYICYFEVSGVESVKRTVVIAR